MRTLEEKDFKLDMGRHVGERIDNLEFNFNSKVLGRIEMLEKAFDS